jgi:hypothetical protein
VVRFLLDPEGERSKSKNSKKNFPQLFFLIFLTFSIVLCARILQKIFLLIFIKISSRYPENFFRHNAHDLELQFMRFGLKIIKIYAK